MSHIVVCALYKFVTLDDYEAMQPPLLAFMLLRNIKGTLLLAQEGINGTIAGDRTDIDAVLQFLQSDPRLARLSFKESVTDLPPFLRSRVKLKK